MPRLDKLLQPLLITLLMAALAACGTIQAASSGQDAGPATMSTPDAAATDAVDAGKAEEKDGTADSASHADTAAQNDAPDATTRDAYIIQPGDLLTISVWRERDLQGEYTIRPDGGLNFPLAGEIDAAGKTIEQLKKEIIARLTKYVPDPVVTITVKQAQGNKIYVVGKVNKPGDFFVNRNVDVMQALSMAGGPNAYASVNKIKILRRVNGEQKTFLFKYSQVEKGKNLEQNIILQGGDIVVVP